MSTVTAVPLLPVKRAYLVWLWIGLALALIAGVALAKGGSTGLRKTPSGLLYKVVKQGSGARLTDSDVAIANYIGRLSNGTVFDKSQQPVPMPVAGMIPGFSEGLKLMNKGAKYQFVIPPALAYGATDNGPIPANSTLRFDVEVIDKMTDAEFQAFRQQMMMMQQRGGMPGGPPPGAR